MSSIDSIVVKLKLLGVNNKVDLEGTNYSVQYSKEIEDIMFCVNCISCDESSNNVDFGIDLYCYKSLSRDDGLHVNFSPNLIYYCNDNKILSIFYKDITVNDYYIDNNFLYVKSDSSFHVRELFGNKYKLFNVDSDIKRLYCDYTKNMQICLKSTSCFYYR